MFKFPAEVRFISARLKNAQFQCFAVGGCIRDQLIGIEPKDYDLVTDASPEQIYKIFDGEVDRVMDLGAAFNITTIVMNGKPFEIAQMRTDIGGDGRHPDEIEFTRDIEIDLGRRDFTINSMAVDIEKGILRDPFAGSMDIDDKIIDFVGDPEKRIEEDYLRILRAFRFKSQLGFKFSEQTYYAIEKYCNVGSLGKFYTALNSGVISQERVTAEFTKILEGKYAFETISMMASMSLLFELIPELRSTLTSHNNNYHKETFGQFGNSIFSHIMLTFKYAVEGQHSKERLVLGLSALLHDIGKDKCRETKPDGTDRFLMHEIVSAKMAEEILTRMKFPNNIIAPVVEICRFHMDVHNAPKIKKVYKLRKLLGKKNIDLLIAFAHADTLGTSATGDIPNIAEADIFKQFMLEAMMKHGYGLPAPLVTGNDLVIQGIKPGIEFKTVLEHAFNSQLDGNENKEKLLKAAIAEIKFLRRTNE